MNLRFLRKLGVTLALAPFLVSCTTGAIQRGGQPPTIVQSNAIAPRQSIISLAEERRIGARAHPQLVAAYGGAYRSPKISGVISSMVKRLEQQTAQSDLRYEITILNSPVVNAFALPGGYIYVTRGLLALANSESELASVLAHEMGHVLLRHAIEREQATRSTVAASRSLAGLMRSQSASEEVLRNAKGYLAQFSRQQELEADALGLKLAAQSGYDPLASASILSSMEAQSRLRAKRFFADASPSEADFLSGHPAPPERIAAIIAQANVLPNAGVADASGRERYIKAVDGILYGDDPTEGYVRGRAFIHPGLRLKFSVPPGFRIDNRPEAINAISEDGDLIRFDGEQIGAGATLQDYLGTIWSSGVSITESRPLEIDGMPGITARASASGWDFRLVAIRWSQTRVFRMLYATRVLTSAKDAAFLEAANTISRLTEREANAIKPLRVRSYRVRSGDTVSSLSSGLPFEDNRAERFRVLNGLNTSGSVRAGSWVKVVGN